AVVGGEIMIARSIPVAFLALSLQTAVAPSRAPNTLTAAEKAAGWQLLFDGRSLDGWRGYRRDTLPDAGWEGKDGLSGRSRRSRGPTSSPGSRSPISN